MTDQDIIIGIKEKNNRVFDILYKMYKNIVLNIVINNSGDNTDVDDVLSIGIMVLYENISIKNNMNIKNNLLYNKKEEIVKLSTYMRSVFYNTWLKELRNRKYLINVENLNDKIPEEPNVYVEEGNSIENVKKKLYIEAMKKLSKICREIILLRHIEKLSYEEIAQKFNHSNINTSKQTKARCFKKLKELANE